MRINSIPTKDLFNQYVHVRSIKTPSFQQTGTDKTELTDGAKMFSTALNEALSTMEARSPEQQQRISAVAEQIRNNTYAVPGAKVAEKILGI